jgi:hypothetical protein
LQFIIDRNATKSVSSDDLKLISGSLRQIRGLTKRSIVVNSFRSFKFINKDCRESIDRAVELLHELRYRLIESEALGFHLSLSQLCECISGLKHFTSDRREVKLSLETMAKSLSASSADRRVSGQSFANMLHGLRYMKDDAPEVNALVHEINKRADDFDPITDSRDVSIALLGLRNFDADHLDAAALRQRIVSSAISRDGSIGPSTNECSAADIIQQITSWNLLRSSGSGFDESAFLGRIVDSLSKTTTIFTSRQISECLRALSKMSSDSSHTRSLAHALGCQLERMVEPMSVRDIAVAVFGLQKMSNQSKEVRLVLNRLAAHMSICGEEDVLDGMDAANVMLGVQRMTSNTREVLKLLSTVSDKLSSDRSPTFRSRDLAHILFGMQSMNCDSREVRRLVSIIASKVRNCADAFSAHDIGISIYGIRWMNSGNVEVSELITALTPKIRACNDAFSTLDVVNCLYGLQSMEDRHVGVRDLVGMLSSKFANLTIGPTDMRVVSNAFLGLRGMSSQDCPEVLGLLEVLQRLLACSTGQVKPRDLADALNGLQNMSSEVPIVREILTLMTPKLRQCSAPLEARDVVRCMYALKSKYAQHHEVLEFVSELTTLISRTKPCLDSMAISKVRNSIKHLSTFDKTVQSLHSVIKDLTLV